MYDYYYRNDSILKYFLCFPKSQSCLLVDKHLDTKENSKMDNTMGKVEKENNKKEVFRIITLLNLNR